LIISYIVFDLSTSGHAGASFVIPSLRLGHVRLNIDFSEAINLDLECLIYCEFLSSLYLPKTGVPTGSYF